MQTLNITDCLKEFNYFLKASKSRVVLAAHNGRVFHSRILAKALFKKNLLRAFQSVVIGFVDTLPLFKNLLPGRQSCKQESLVEDCLNKSYDFHNSLEDVKSLSDLLLYHNPSCSSLSVHSFTVGFVSQSLQHYERETVNLPSFKCPVADKILTNARAKRIAGSGLNLHQIRLIHARGGYDGLHSVLSSKSSNGRSVVTASKKVLQTLSNYLEKKKILPHQMEINDYVTFAMHQ